MLKAVAEPRGWEHHRHYHRAASRIRAETGDGDIRRLFAVASDLRENFNENHLDSAAVAESLDDVGDLLGQADTPAEPNVAAAAMPRRATQSPVGQFPV